MTYIYFSEPKTIEQLRESVKDMSVDRLVELFSEDSVVHVPEGALKESTIRELNELGYTVETHDYPISKGVAFNVTGIAFLVS